MAIEALTVHSMISPESGVGKCRQVSAENGLALGWLLWPQRCCLRKLAPEMPDERRCLPDNNPPLSEFHQTLARSHFWLSVHDPDVIITVLVHRPMAVT